MGFDFSFSTTHRHSPDLADIFVGDIYTVITEGPKAVPFRVAWIHKVGYCLFSYVTTALFNCKTKQAQRKLLENNYFILPATENKRISKVFLQKYKSSLENINRRAIFAYMVETCISTLFSFSE